MIDERKTSKNINDARNKVIGKLEETLGPDGEFKLYHRKLPGYYVDVIIKDYEILAKANDKVEDLFKRVDFKTSYESKGDNYKDIFKNAYNSCQEAISSNANIGLNALMMGVIGPIYSPKRYSIGYNVYEELNFSVKELKKLDPIYFKKLDDSNKYIDINKLAGLIYPVSDNSFAEKIDEDGKIEDSDMVQTNYSRNKIIFGPPGVGKSYSIKSKLNLINVKDKNIIRTTFHPEYSYYEFVGQYKPVVAYERVASQIRYQNKNDVSNERPFVYYDFVPGPFIKAIIKALKLENKYTNQETYNALLIIEEINRGNSSAIFGDIFQLLDRINNVNNQYYGESEYSIDLSSEIKEYIKKELKWEEKDWENRFPRGFVIPSNLYIYATMNTSDQSLYPMDSAFKRRWDMDYIYINYKEDKLEDLYLPAPYDNIKWLEFIEIMNKEIVSYTGVDDKQLGQWFVGYSLSDAEFLGKVISYLWFDIFRYDPQVIFKKEIRTFDDIRNKYKKGVFRKELFQKIGEEENRDDGE